MLCQLCSALLRSALLSSVWLCCVCSALLCFALLRSALLRYALSAVPCSALLGSAWLNHAPLRYGCYAVPDFTLLSSARLRLPGCARTCSAMHCYAVAAPRSSLPPFLPRRRTTTSFAAQTSASSVKR